MDQMEQETQQLEHQLKEALAAEDFFNLASGKLFQELATRKINYFTKQILSDKFDKDHVGFVNTKAELNAYKTLLHMMQVAASPDRKNRLRERLGRDNG